MFLKQYNHCKWSRRWTNRSSNHVIRYFVMWPTNAQLFLKLLHSSYMFRHYRVILREPVINILPCYTSISNAAVGNTIYNSDVSHRFYASSYIIVVEIIKHMRNILIVNYITNSCNWNTCVAWQGWLQAVWGRHDSVETCSSVIVCEITVRLLVIEQNNKRCTVHGIEINKYML